MRIALFILGGGCLAMVAFARFLFLARFRLGWVMYVANVVWETVAKKTGRGRFGLELMTAVLGLALLLIAGTPGACVAVIGLALLLLEMGNRGWERKIVNDVYLKFDSRGPAPSVHPELILTVEGPFIERLPGYRLGVLRNGAPFDLELIVANASRAPVQAPVRVRLGGGDGWLCKGSADQEAGIIQPGGIAKVLWTLCPAGSSGAGTLSVEVEWGGVDRRILIEHDGIIPAADMRIEHVGITRYPGGRRSAFAWRGDMDLYDTVTLQSVEGLEVALGLGARYRFPQTLCLSTRLSLDQGAAREWADHYSVDRGADEIPRFIRWMRENVDLRHSCSYPAQSGKRYVMELGNHGHLHYDTATSPAPENGWRSHARMGAGRYPWVGEDASSFGEQRDNAFEARSWCERLLDFSPRSWAKPGACNDADTPRAVEAAGCEVVSGSDIRARDTVLFQPPPHHPDGTSAVELTTRYPCDPQHIYHMGMLLFWLHRSRRLGIPMVYMCHQHLRQFDGHACERLTEYLIRTVLAGFQGEFYVDTMFGVGKYWRELLSPKTRRVTLAQKGNCLSVENLSDSDFERVPVDVNFADGGRCTVLVGVRAGATVSIDMGPVSPQQEK